MPRNAGAAMAARFRRGWRAFASWLQRGATVPADGAPIPGAGNFFAPTLIADLPDDSRLMTNGHPGRAVLSRLAGVADPSGPL